MCCAVLSAGIDWFDFVVVETIEFPEDELFEYELSIPMGQQASMLARCRAVQCSAVKWGGVWCAVRCCTVVQPCEMASRALVAIQIAR